MKFESNYQLRYIFEGTHYGDGSKDNSGDKVKESLSKEVMKGLKCELPTTCSPCEEYYEQRRQRGPSPKFQELQ